MQVTTAQLNQVAALMNTTDKNAVITVAIGTLVKSGVDVRTAMDAVLGEGSYTKLAHQVWESFQPA